MYGSGVNASSKLLKPSVWLHSEIDRDEAASLVFPPLVRWNIIKIACERPQTAGRALSQWDCVEIARQIIETGLAESLSRESVRKILEDNRLKPWRHKMWLSGMVARDATFAAAVLDIAELYTRQQREDEIVLCVDEKTNLQPRPRRTPTRAAMPGWPNQVEHEYKRDGALNLFSAFDINTGKVIARTAPRKRQEEFIPLLEDIDRFTPESIKTIHLILDNVSVHKGRKVRAWLEKHPRFVCHHPPVHCSWMNQVEQWFSILARKGLKIVDFTSKEHLEQYLMAYVEQWNDHAHTFDWSYRSFIKILLKCDQVLCLNKDDPAFAYSLLPRAA